MEDSHFVNSSSRTASRRMARRSHPCPCRMYFSVGHRRRTDRPCHSPSIESTRRRSHLCRRHKPCQEGLCVQGGCPPLHQFFGRRRDPSLCQACARSCRSSVRIRHRGQTGHTRSMCKLTSRGRHSRQCGDLGRVCVGHAQRLHVGREEILRVRGLCREGL